MSFAAFACTRGANRWSLCLLVCSCVHWLLLFCLVMLCLEGAEAIWKNSIGFAHCDCVTGQMLPGSST